jgi:hypothetical protein
MIAIDSPTPSQLAGQVQVSGIHLRWLGASDKWGTPAGFTDSRSSPPFDKRLVKSILE